jgi:hypothetical protein
MLLINRPTSKKTNSVVISADGCNWEETNRNSLLGVDFTEITFILNHCIVLHCSRALKSSKEVTEECKNYIMRSSSPSIIRLVKLKGWDGWNM